MNSAAVCPKSRCSSVRSSRTKTSSGFTGVVRNCPPAAGACACAMVLIPLVVRVGSGSNRIEGPRVTATGQGPPERGHAVRFACRRVDYAAGRKYKPDIVPPLSELFTLDGRTAIVTGGSRGLGQEMAEGLAEAGASLMLCARRDEWLTPTVNEMRGQGFKVEGLICDVSKPADVQAVVDKTIAAFGKVDILVNNAGVTWAAEPEDLPLDKWQKVVDINLTGAFLFSQAAGREMLKRQWGRIINTASIAGMHASVHGPHYAPYAATKAGLIGLTRELAVSWARKGIRVNAIAPGFFHSRLADGAIAMNEASIRESSPIPRVGGEGELKGVAVFLASDASNYITGQTIVVDGGRTLA